MDGPTVSTRPDRPAETLYDDPEIRVLWYPGRKRHGAYVLITFGDLINLADADRFFAEAPARKSGIPCVGFMAKRANWFPAASMAAASGAVLARVGRFAQRITYGGSMGGYAAVKYSALLRATHVVALCPQWSIDPAECDGRTPGWAEHFVPAMAGMGIRAADVAGAVLVFADVSEPLDRFHAHRIGQACAHWQLVHVPSVGHHVTSVFAGTENLLHLLDACRAGATARVLRLVRDFRKGHWLRRQILIERAVRRRPDLIFPAILRAARRHEPWVLQRPDYLFLAADWLIARGEPSQARDVLRFLAAVTDDPRGQLRVCAALSRLEGARIVLGTHHGTQLVYDVAADRCRHAARADGTGAVDLQLDVEAMTLSLSVVLDGARIDLQRDAAGLLCLCPRTPGPGQPVRFEIESQAPGWFSLRAAARYLCADPDGWLACDRPGATAWERFRFAMARAADPA